MKERIFYDYIQRNKSLKKEIDILNENLTKKEIELEKSQQQCKHPIIAIHYISYGYSVDANCVICGKNFHTPYELREIDHYYELNFYKSKNFFTKKSANMVVDKKIKEFFSNNPYMTVEKLYENLKDLL